MPRQLFPTALQSTSYFLRKQSRQKGSAAEVDTLPFINYYHIAIVIVIVITMATLKARHCCLQDSQRTTHLHLYH
jgi:hypothetical protein